MYLRVERSDTPFTRGYNAGQVIRVPVAHGEGNYVADERNARRRLEGEGRVLFRYSAPDGSLDTSWNINGATNSIAGIVNDKGNVLGMMPHPENHVENVDRLDRRARIVRGPRRAIRQSRLVIGHARVHSLRTHNRARVGRIVAAFADSTHRAGCTIMLTLPLGAWIVKRLGLLRSFAAASLIVGLRRRNRR